MKRADTNEKSKQTELQIFCYFPSVFPFWPETPTCILCHSHHADCTVLYEAPWQSAAWTTVEEGGIVWQCFSDSPKGACLGKRKGEEDCRSRSRQGGEVSWEALAHQQVQARMVLTDMSPVPKVLGTNHRSEGSAVELQGFPALARCRSQRSFGLNC